MDHRITVQSGAEAWLQLSDPVFLEKWEQLYADCPWATPYQSPGFACTWYDHYREQFSPVIISLDQDEQRLSGLLLLALSVQQHELVVAGGHQIEYRVWLGTQDQQGEFIQQTLATLDDILPGYAQ